MKYQNYSMGYFCCYAGMAEKSEFMQEVIRCRACKTAWKDSVTDSKREGPGETRQVNEGWLLTDFSTQN